VQQNEIADQRAGMRCGPVLTEPTLEILSYPHVSPSGPLKNINSNHKNGRGGEIRTRGLYVPNVALYQAKLHPVDFCHPLQEAEENPPRGFHGVQGEFQQVTPFTGPTHGQAH
jgi:hypothetical protein